MFQVFIELNLNNRTAIFESITSYPNQTLRKHNFSHSALSRKTIVCYSRRTFLYANGSIERQSSFDGITNIAEVYKRIFLLALPPCCTIKSVFPYALYILPHRYAPQFGTIRKRSCSYICYAFGNYDGCQTRTAGKRTFAYIRYTIGKNNACQIFAT